MGNLYFGDNLEILRNHIKDESVDLVYLDPPFNSKRDYNLLFKTPKGHTSDASITAFEDSWHWGRQAETEYDEILHHANSNVAEMVEALRRFLGENDMMAYLVMMCNRLLELHRVLKRDGSLYLHCDPSASHYLKIILDGVFGKENFRNEIIWQRTNVHSDSKTWSRVSDNLYFYTKSDHFTWNPQYVPHSDAYVRTKYTQSDEDGRLYMLDNMTSPNPRPNMMYEWKGFPSPRNGWRYSFETMSKLDTEGRIWYPSDTSKRPRYKRFLEETSGTLLGNVWTDIPPINSQASERLGYPTQKPLALLERILNASCPEDGVVLDPFCGCGTAIHAAQRLEKQWIGIDITHLAIAVIEERLGRHFPGIRFETHGTPRDIDAAKDLAKRDKYEFQYWVCHLLGAQPYQNKKKGADGGIDGIIYFKDVGNVHKKAIISVKGGENVGVSMIRDLCHVVAREKAEIGLFVTLTDPTRPMKDEATKAGFYSPPFIGKKFSKLQILTVEGILKGTERPEYPSLERGGVPVKKPKGQAKDQMSFLLPYNGTKQDEMEVDVTVPAIDGYDVPSVNQTTDLPRCKSDKERERKLRAKRC